MPTHHSAAHLRLDGISLSYGERRVLTDVSLTAAAGQRLGLIGENGSGKTTLLRIAAGLLEPDTGTVRATVPGGRAPRIGLLHQRPPFADSDTVADALESAVAHVRGAAGELDAAAARMAAAPEDEWLVAAYGAALEAAERLGVWDVDARIDAMTAGLGLAGLDRARPTGRLSGGQRSRLALAWLLLSQPDVLLLDEPTNHLDDAATAHLRAVLAAWTGPVLLASHDRAFLDETVTGLVDLDPSPLPHAVSGPLLGDGTGTGIGVTRFTGSYTEYLLERIEARSRWTRRYREEQAELRRLRSQAAESHSVGHANRAPRTEARAAKKFYSDRNAKVVKRRVDDARARLAQLEDNQIRRPPQELRFRGLTAALDGGSVPAGEPGTGGRFSGPVLAASEVAVDARLAPISLTVSAGEKWLVTGVNGSGKSTLLAVLAGHLAPSSGTVNRPRGLTVGLLAQEVELPDPHGRGRQRTVGEAYADLVGARRAKEVPLAAFGLVAGRDENRPLTTLSVGQQRRVALAALLADPPDVLLLDEPTNHLALLLVTELEVAIPHYPGAVVVASHDRWLRHGWQGRHLEVTPVGAGGAGGA